MGRVKIDRRGRIVIPREMRGKLGIEEEEELEIRLEGDRIIIKRVKNPFKVLEGLLGDLTFSRDLRKVAEEEATKEVGS